jgi:hypothetical protein
MEKTAEQLQKELKEARRLLKAFCKATNPDEAYGWVFDQMRLYTSKEREAAEKFLKATK